MAETVKLVCATCGQTNRVPRERLAGGPKCGSCGEALADGRVHELDGLSHDKAVRDDELPLLVDYWAPWCGPCRMMAPEFAKAAKSLAPQVRLAKLNTEDHPAISQRAQIRGIPALVLYRRGREVARLAGARPAADIVAFVQGHMAARA
ncbi:thioredoxin TrxC [Paragemmobacter straminiformis]|uniref:Thioredoxin n=1 Tax=Paragemmobacter straminiformis TaxID=2045119 RepID=A0A842I336_9RHOB|nr:thioredoxin TrxC [Gemmobacter straminiformis]MBC2834146.1 thioredoxin TrxC [Gemmobacter straminiformis]